MYTMKVITSFVFHLMMFPHEGKVVTLYQLTYYEPQPATNVDNVFPIVGARSSSLVYMDVGLNL